MHLGYVLKKFPRLSETFILNEILELQRQGHTVTVLSLYPPDDGVFHRQLADLATPIVYLPTRKTAATTAHLRSALPLLREARDGLWFELEDLLSGEHLAPLSVIGWGIDVALIARARGIEHLHAHFATIASDVARAAHSLSGIPYSFTCHAKDIYRETVRPARFRALARGAKCVVTVCDANQRHIESHLAEGEPLPIARVYNGIDVRAFRVPTAPRDAMPCVLSVGRLVEKKGFRDLITAVGRLRADGEDLRCIIVGDGEDRANLERCVDDAGLRGVVELVGARPQEQVLELMQRATVFALPCIVGADGNRDALPTVLLEAIASGLPCISTPVGGVEEILADGSGVLVPESDPAALADAIRAQLADPALRAQLARRGRARAERLFDLRLNVARLAELFAVGVRVAERVL